MLVGIVYQLNSINLQRFQTLIQSTMWNWDIFGSKKLCEISSMRRAWVAQWVRQWDYLTTYISLSPIRRGFASSFVNYKIGCTRLAAASDKVYQLLAHGRWFSLASSTTKTGCHDIAEILPKVALNTINQIKSNQIKYESFDWMCWLSTVMAGNTDPIQNTTKICVNQK